jgi:nitrogen-specific signal transduction histidine kinase
MFLSMNIDLPQLERLGNAVADGMVLGTPDGTVLSASPRARSLLGLAPDAPNEDVARVLSEALHPIDETLLPLVESPLRRAAEAMFDHEDVRCDGADGCMRRLRLAGLTLANGESGLPVVVVVLRELPPPPPPLAEPLQLDPELRRLHQLRDEILSIASHELKNPLTVILGYSAVLAGAPAVTGEPRLARAAAAVRHQSQRMRRLVDQLLDFSRLGLGQLTLQRAPFDLAEQVRLVVANHSTPPLSLKAAIPPEPLMVYGDAMRIERVLATLLADALRHEPHSGMVSVSVERTNGGKLPGDAYGAPARDLPYAVVRVYDPNLPADGADYEAFAHYTPSGNWDTPQADHWLGLYVGAQVLLLHNGLIWIEQHAGTGGTLAYALPLHEPSRHR